VSDARAELEALRIKEIERLAECVKDLTREVTDLRIQVGRLEIKSGLYGFLSGLPASITAILYTLWKVNK